MPEKQSTVNIPPLETTQLLEIFGSIKEELRAIRSQFEEFKKEVNSAFPKDDEGNVSYYEHRAYHKNQKDLAKRMDDYKVDFTKKVVGWLGILILGAIGSALWATYIGG